MPLLLLLPLLVLALLVLWVVLLPFVLWARYRNGKARRRAVGWVIRVNAWLLLGVLLGIASLWLTRFKPDTRGFHYTPNRCVVLTLTVLVAVRIVAGLVIGWHNLGAEHTAVAVLLDAGSLLAIAGVFLGYALAYTWGLRGQRRSHRGWGYFLMPAALRRASARSVFSHENAVAFCCLPSAPT